MSEIHRTADGIVPYVGMRIYIHDVWHERIETHIVKKVYRSKVLYEKPLPGGYIGARTSAVYANLNKLEATLGSTQDSSGPRS